MEWFEEKAMKIDGLKPKMVRYVDDTFVKWRYGEDGLKRFMKHLKSTHINIQFAMDTKKNEQLPFLDVPVKKQTNKKFSTRVYKKAYKLTDTYLPMYTIDFRKKRIITYNGKKSNQNSRRKSRKGGKSIFMTSAPK